MRLRHSAIAASGAAPPPPPQRAGHRPAGNSPPISGAGPGAGVGRTLCGGRGSEWVPQIGVEERFPL
jgi:hypothetical protein